jgi:hypothetical protein
MNIDDKLRQEIGLPLADLLKKFVDTGNSSEPQMSFYSGYVVNNNDPDKLGRCKIRVLGVYEEEISSDDLPWAIPDFNFIGGQGSFIVPPIDQLVRVYFDNNDYHTPRYTTKVIANKTRFQADKDSDYPDTMVFFETDQGEYFKINRKTYLTTYKHASGTIITIDKQGNININNNFSPGVGGNLTIGIEGNTTLNCGGNIDAIAEGDVTVQGNSVTLKTHDGSMWQPNTVSKCFFNGQHHGGSLIGTGVGGPIEFIEGRDI